MLRNVKVCNQGDPRNSRTRKMEIFRDAYHKYGKRGHWANKCHLRGKRKRSHHSSYDKDSISKSEASEDEDLKLTSHHVE